MSDDKEGRTRGADVYNRVWSSGTEGMEDVPVRVTQGDSQASWFDEELRCYCHLVVKAGAVTRFTSPTMAGPFTSREEPFPDEGLWGV